MKTLFLGVLATAVWAQTPQQLRATAERSIAVIERGVGGFIKTQDCFSCHSHALPALAYRTARRHGIAVNEGAATAMAAKAFKQTVDLNSIENALQDQMIIDPVASQGWGLILADAAGVKPSLATGVHARLIASWQREDGHWPILDMRPPQSDSLVTATAIAVRAVQLYLPVRREAEERTVRARQWLLAVRPVTTEDHTFRLLGLHWSGTGSAERTAAAKDLVALQRSNGGWAQFPGMQPDAYATGQALMALHQAGGIPANDPVYRKGIRYLLSSQKADGSWQVATRMVSPAAISPPYFESGFPHGKNQMISIAATCWAAMAIMTALPEVRNPAAPSPPQLAAAEEPWMETALFGSSEQLKELLDRGLDPNTKTASGVTLLMFAAPDAARLKLLIDRGADVKAKARTGYTALMIAAMYRGSGDAVKLLLDAGAEAVPGTGVMFNASPLFLATMAGDTGNIALLRAKGADPKRQMLVMGIFLNSPLFISIVHGEPTLIQAVLAAGGDPREVDADGMTVLHWAALSKHPEAARILAAAGVPLNQPDKHGFTPLMYAATIDYGNAEMVKTLLAAGADRNVKTRDGKTALSQAKQFRYTHIAEALQTPRK